MNSVCSVFGVISILFSGNMDLQQWGNGFVICWAGGRFNC